MRVNGDPAAFTPELRAIALDVDPGLRLYELLTLDEVVRRRDLPMILGTLAVTGVVLFAMLLSAMGLFADEGVMRSLDVRRFPGGGA